ncbi:MAG: Fic family protein [Terricaulis sp.]
MTRLDRHEAVSDRICQAGERFSQANRRSDRDCQASDRNGQMTEISDRIGQPVSELRGVRLPESAILAGYSALIDQHDLQLPLPRRLVAIGTRRTPPSSERWSLLNSRQAVPGSLGEHLEFAFRHEGVNLSVLSALFSAVAKEDLEAWISAAPGGAVTRRVWFIYEWMTGQLLDVPPVPKIRAVPIIDREKQFGLEGGNRSARHSVIDNLPGTREFCPLVWRTPKLDDFEAEGFDQRAREVVGRTHPDVIARAAAFLLLDDSKKSFFIENERPTTKLIQRWAQAISEAGSQPLSVQELERLQKIVLADARFVRPGVRKIGGFVGQHDRITRDPLPVHVSAKWQDLASLMNGLVAYSHRAKVNKVDAVTTAAALAFGFVYIHPFEDGNGRVHRWLFHHILSQAGYNPPGVVFPISSTIYRRIDEYKRVLESYSQPLLEFIDWKPTPDHNVEVLNDTANYYRYFDATLHAEFLYECVKQTVESDLPDEVAYLEAYDKFSQSVLSNVDMPNSMVDLLHRFLRQNGGKLSKRARTKEFELLTDEEVEVMEGAYASAFEGLNLPPEELEEDDPSSGVDEPAA